MSAIGFARARLAAAVGALAALSLAAPASAQGLPIPPRNDSKSPTGVSYGTGTFTHTVRDLAIGGEFPQSLREIITAPTNINVCEEGVHGVTGKC